MPVKARAAKPKPPPRQRPRQSPKPAAAPDLLTVLREDGSVDKAHDPRLDTKTLLALYRAMVETREFDRRMLLLQRQGTIGFYGPILGQEAATCASAAAMHERDWIFPALREHAAAMMRGLTMQSAIAQLIGNAEDRSKGRQMPCHYTHKESRFVSMSSVIGTQISHAVGCAMACKLRRDKAVVLGYLGDGATSANDFHAGMNFAAVMKSPVVLFCQNNGWAISVPCAAQSVSKTIAIKAKAYGMPFVRVDGNDALAVYAVTQAAAEHARKGLGPTFIEAVTYRRLGHSSSDDPTKYRDEGEVEAWEKKDPIERMKRYLLARGSWSEKHERALAEETAKKINDAIAAAERVAAPAVDTLITDVFTTPTPQLQEQLEELRGSEAGGGRDGAFPL